MLIFPQKKRAKIAGVYIIKITTIQPRVAVPHRIRNSARKNIGAYNGDAICLGTRAPHYPFSRIIRPNSSGVMLAKEIIFAIVILDGQWGFPYRSIRLLLLNAVASKPHARASPELVSPLDAATLSTAAHRLS